MPLVNVQQLRDEATRLITCAPLSSCRYESDCLHVAQALLRLLPDTLIDELLPDILVEDPQPAPPDDPDTVFDYAVDWSTT